MSCPGGPTTRREYLRRYQLPSTDDGQPGPAAAAEGKEPSTIGLLHEEMTPRPRAAA